MTRDWDAATYHRVSSPHVEWARVLLDRLDLAGDETVLDAVPAGAGRPERLPAQSGLSELGGFHVVGVACSTREAGELAQAQPEVALVDVGVEGGGAAATREILAASPRTRILGHSAVAGLGPVI
ncbi:MAG: hypothetical protein ACRDL0_05765, partial [Thermoleophilaceae bacterium]